ncbi:hypothetical protein K3555_22870 (plasmid) [Leisingera sp. M527]|uniref:hypothetical protein n=1 Tax=Leisingera sp. M527 TaxID=2867014 RepID=UPI0021A45094|nr:hypothetical protein [Leisingera sp. M527]UWQ35370.1 hypothetical protein K3555_22870 [Leisingera sp. M527]
MSIRFLMSAVLAAVPGNLAAQACVEPVRPELAYLEDAGFTGAELREHYRLYFADVEVYLNCLNAGSGRIREEARAAAYDYQQVLNRHPHATDAETAGEHNAPEVSMRESGDLYLSYKPGSREGDRE